MYDFIAHKIIHLKIFFQQGMHYNCQADTLNNQSTHTAQIPQSDLI